MQVVLIHGMFVGPACWQHVSELLAVQGIVSRTIRLHPEGIDKRDRGFRDVVASVLPQLRELDEAPAILVGHSVGALVVEKVASSFPTSNLMLVNPSPSWGRLGPLFPLWFAARRGSFWKREFRLTIPEARRLLFQGMTPLELDKASQVLEPESGELMREAFWFFDLFGAATRISRNIGKRVTVITGSLDPFGTPAYGMYLSKTYGPACDLEVIQGAGHMSIMQGHGARRIVERITEMLKV